jgi:hypothetical protein
MTGKSPERREKMKVILTLQTKTHAGWQGPLHTYLNIGDLVDDDLYDHFIGVVPPVCFRSGLVQMGEAAATGLDGKPLYLTLQKHLKGWVFTGPQPAYERVTLEVPEFLVQIKRREGTIAGSDADEGRIFTSFENYDHHMRYVRRMEALYCMKVDVLITHVESDEGYACTHEVINEGAYKGLRERVLAYCDWVKGDQFAGLWLKLKGQAFIEECRENTALWEQRMREV